MSSTVLWGITKDFKREEIGCYHNSWLFSPVVWRVLGEKYLNIKEPLMRNSTYVVLNRALNNSKSTSDRILWELSNEQIFFAKDAEFIKKSVEDFLKDNNKYDVDEGQGILELDHIIERFKEITKDIFEYKDIYEYFVIQGTTVGTRIDEWFWDEDNDCSCPMRSDSKAEFVIIENGEIKDFALAKEIMR